MRGIALSPMDGVGSDESPIRPQLHDREKAQGDRQEYITGARDHGLVMFDVADPSNFGDYGGIILADLTDLDSAMSRVPAAKRQRFQNLARDYGVDGTGRLSQVVNRIGRVLNGNFAVAKHLGESLAPTPGSFAVDTFTDTSAVLLQNHTADTGGPPVKHGSAGQDLKITDANRLRGSSTGTHGLYYWTAAPATAEYDVGADIHQVTSTAQEAGICGRMETGANTMYLLQHWGGGSDAYELRKLVAGVSSLLGSYVSTIGNGNTVAMVLEVRDATKKSYIAGVERISSADNVITAAGQAGVRQKSADNNTTSFHLDNFAASDLAGAASVPRRGLLLGVG